MASDDDVVVEVGQCSECGKVQRAVADDRNQITRTLVGDVEGEARADMQAQSVRELDTDKRLLYEIIQTEGEVDAGEFHRRYEERAQDPVTRSTRRKYLARLSEYELVEETGEGRGRRYLAAP